MRTAESTPAGFLGPTADLLLAALGVAVVTYPVAASASGIVDLPVLTPGSLTALVAVAGSYPFVAGRWSLGALGDYVLVWTAALLGIGIAVFPLAVGVGGIPRGIDAWIEALHFVAAHLAAFVAVKGYGVAPTR